VENGVENGGEFIHMYKLLHQVSLEWIKHFACGHILTRLEPSTSIAIRLSNTTIDRPVENRVAHICLLDLL